MKKVRKKISERIARTINYLRIGEHITVRGISISLRKLPKTITGNPKMTVSAFRRPWIATQL